MTTTTVYCWVYGEDVGNIIPIDILTTSPLGALKKSIKTEKSIRFRDVDPDTLHLYSIPIVEGQLEDDLIKWRPAGQSRRNARDKVSTIGDQLIIVVEPSASGSRATEPPVAVPDITVNCWVRGQPAKCVFPVKISNKELVGTLKKVIKAEKSVDFRDIDADALALYKVSLLFDANVEAILDAYTPDPEQFLPPLKALSNIFLDVPLEEHIHIVVEAPLSVRLRPRPQLSTFSRSVHNITTLRNEFLKNNAPQPPSTAAKLQPFTRRQASAGHTIFCNRPHHACATIPPSLLHPVFGQFLDECETYEATRDDNFLTQELHVAMSNLYEDEAARARDIRDIFSRWGLHFNVTYTNDGYKTDGDMSEGAHRYVIAEFKNEVGSTGAEPYHQASLYYMEFTRPHAGRLFDSALPCLNIILCGPYITFAGATWNLRPVVQPLSLTLGMHYHPTDTRTMAKVARHIGAFKRAVRTLKEYYQDLTSRSPVGNVVNEDYLYPYRKDFIPLLGNEDAQTFKYECQPFQEKLIFFGTLCDEQPICIKFVPRYSREAHEACASLGCAPKLLGFEAMPGGWFMVVMDMLTEQEYNQFTKHTPTASLTNNIRGALKQLHEKGYVHGDVRDTNIMVSNSDKTKFMLLDFDWAGKAGEVRYPMLVNRTENLWRPEGAVDGAPIRAEHDMDMLRDIEGRYGTKAFSTQ